MRVHLRFSNKDDDLCRWRHSIKSNLLTEYIARILIAESKGKIAYIPNADKLSSKIRPCDISVYILDEDAVQYILSIPPRSRNGKIKAVIRKHLQSQRFAVKEMDPQVILLQKSESPVKQTPLSVEERKASETQTSANKKPQYTETEEDRAAIQALIAMSGE